MRPMRPRGFFDRWASSYDRSILQHLMFGPVQDAVLDAFSGASARPNALLDVGCGTGRLLEAASRKWDAAQLTGVDASEAMVAEARRKHEGDARFSFTLGDASSLPLEPASFDGATSTYSLHHWGDQVLGIREVARVLRPGGLFVLADMDPPLRIITAPILKRFDGSSVLSPGEILRLLEQADFSVLYCRRFWRFSRVQMFVARRKGANGTEQR